MENLEILVVVLRSELGLITVGLSLAAIRTVATQERIFYTETTGRSSVDDSDDQSAYSNIPCHPSHCCQPTQMLYLVKFVITSVPLNFLIICRAE